MCGEAMALLGEFRNFLTEFASCVQQVSNTARIRRDDMREMYWLGR